MAFSADTMAVTLALAKKYTNTSIANSLTGVKSIEPDSTKTKLIVTTMDDQVFEIDIQQTFTAEQVELINRMSIINDELAFDGVVIEGLTPEQSALLVSFNDHIQNFSNPHKTRISNLTDVEIDTPIDGQVIMLEDGKYKNKTLNIPTDGKVKMEDGSPSKFLSEQIDGTTISKNETNTLSAVGLKGMDTSIPELNYISGLDEPIMTKFAKFGNGNIEVYKTVFPTYASLIQFDFTTLTQGTTFLMYVSDDETHQNLGTIYLCDKDTNDTDNLPSYAGLSSAPQRDFTVDKINLETEVKGVLPKANMDLSGLATSDELVGYMSKSVYDPNNDGIVNSAETLKGLTKTPQELNKDIGIDSIKAGSNVTIEKDEINNTVTINSTGGSGGGSSVSKSDINGNIINNGEQMVVYDDTEIQSEIDSLNHRGVVGAKGEYGYFMLSSNMTTNIGNNLPIRFSQTVEKNVISLNPSNYSVLLNANVTYRLTLQIQCGGTSSSPVFKFFNLTENKYIGHELYTPAVSYNSTLNGGNTNNILYTPSRDCEITANFLSAEIYPSTVFANRTALIVEEISRTYTLDPVEYAQNHDVITGSFKLADNHSTIAGGSYLRFTNRVNGNFVMNSDGTFLLKKGKTYDISIGILAVTNMLQVQLYDITNSRLFGNTMDCIPPTSTHTFNSLPNINTQITPTSDILVGARVTVSNSTSLLNTDICYFNIKEIKNPVVVEYTNLKEISNPLMSSQISQEAPIGTVIDYLGDDIPNYYLLCDGSIYNIQDYQQLFNKIGNKYGGDGVTTFAVPNITLTNGKSYIKSEATHYAVNQYGGFQMDTLWEGSININDSVINLVSEYTEYDGLYVESEYSGISSNNFILKSSIEDNVSSHGIQVLGVSDNTTGSLMFTSDKTIKLTNTIGNIIVTKIVGLKGSLPTVLEGGSL